MSALEEHALAKALDGETIPGWKVVAGRSIRKISDPEEAKHILDRAGFGPEEYLKQELKGISDLEKLMGKKSFATLLGPYVVKPQGKPALAPIDDPRPEYSQAEADFNNL